MIGDRMNTDNSWQSKPALSLFRDMMDMTERYEKNMPSENIYQAFLLHAIKGLFDMASRENTREFVQECMEEAWNAHKMFAGDKK
jgi:hypothetical protein